MSFLVKKIKNQFIKNQFSKSSKGFSIIQALLITSVSIIVAGTLGQLFINFLKSQKTLEQDLEIANIHHEILTLLSNVNSCTNTVVPLPPGTRTTATPNNIPLTVINTAGGGPSPYQVGLPIQNGNISITNFNFGAYTADATFPGFGQIPLNITYRKDREAFGQKSIIRTIILRVFDNNSPNFNQCRAFGGLIEGPWQSWANINGGVDAIYNAGSVGIGPNFGLGGVAVPANIRLAVDGNAQITNDLIVQNNAFAQNFFFISDRDFKEEIEPIQQPLESLMKLKGVSFKWKNNKRKSLGLIAQEVEQIFPELVSTNLNNKKSVQYGGLIALLIETTKKLYAREQMLVSEISTLKKENEKIAEILCYHHPQLEICRHY